MTKPKEGRASRATAARAAKTRRPEPRRRERARPIDWDALFAAARAVRANAYAPYSGFEVGAAALARDGRTFVGCNVENASYGLAMCAERAAVAAATAAGTRDIVAIAVVAPGPTPVTPCGMCRQVIAELGRGIAIKCYTPYGEVFETDSDVLLPHAFDRATLERSRG